MKIINQLKSNRKRAVSPVIAVILLIGLAVAAAAAIFIVVLPLLQTTSSLEIIDGYVLYDADHTSTMDEGISYGMGYVDIANVGTGEVDVNNISIYYKVGSDWVKIPDSDAWSMKNITTNTPWTISVTQQDTLRIRFILPSLNIDSEVTYRITVTPEEGRDLDTNQADEVDDADMQLSEDRPQITYTRTLGTIRRTYTISPTAVIDNSNEVKNVTYEVYNASSLLVNRTKTITSSTSWPWQWNTFNSGAEGLENGSYKLKMTVYDYAGLSSYVWENDTQSQNFTIDNDYMNPVILGVIGSSTKGGEGTAEVGESYSINANITDSGSGDSDVESAYIHYKINSSSDESYATALMTKSIGNSWIGNIPAPFIDSDALTNNLAFNISASDQDTNGIESDHYYASVEDTTEPNFVSHLFRGATVIDQALIADEGQSIIIVVAVEDKDQVDIVNLVWRTMNDTSYNETDPWNVYTNLTGTGSSWEFQIPAISSTLDGIEYYLNATDLTGNVEIQDGSGDVPYKVSIADDLVPTMSVIGILPSSITEQEPLSVTLSLNDNDQTFSWMDNETGRVEIGYKQSSQSIFTYTDMTHASGDSTQAETAIWDGSLSGTVFDKFKSPVAVRIRATDQSGKQSIQDHSISVVPGGVPVIEYVDDSVDVSGASSHILEFRINNSAGGGDDATANITDIKVELFDNTKTYYLSGDPYIVQINASAGLNPVWENSTPSEGTNGTTITLDSPFDLTKGGISYIWLVYANSSGGYFDINDYTVQVTVTYKYTGGVRSDTLVAFDTPVTASEPHTETRYMKNQGSSISGYYDLGVWPNTAADDQKRIDVPDNTFPITWGIRVFIRHSDSSETQITLDLEATVSRVSGDWQGYLSAAWNCPYTVLDPTDRIVVKVYLEYSGSGEIELAVFTTEELGATKLESAQWTMYYWIRVDDRRNRTTRADFNFGDTDHNSRITNIVYGKPP